VPAPGDEVDQTKDDASRNGTNVSAHGSPPRHRAISLPVEAARAAEDVRRLDGITARWEGRRADARKMTKAMINPCEHVLPFLLIAAGCAAHDANVTHNVADLLELTRIGP
jgi:hypothetical protein